MENELHDIAAGVYAIRSELDDVSHIASPLYKIAEILARPVGFWERLRIRFMNWRWRHAIKNGPLQKEWSEKTRDALSEWERKANGTEPSKENSAWRSLWQ